MVRFMVSAILVAGLCCCSLAADLEDIPLVEVNLDQNLQVHKLGVLPFGSSKQVRIGLFNKTGEDIEIKEVKLSCGCLSVEPGARFIAANAHTVFRMKLDISKAPGSQSPAIEIVYTKEGQVKRKRLHFSYTARGDFQIQLNERHWLIDSGSPQQNQEFVFYISAYDNYDIANLELSVLPDFFNVVKKGNPPREGETASLAVSVALKKEAELGFPMTMTVRAMEKEPARGGRAGTVYEERVVLNEWLPFETHPSNIVQDNDGKAIFFVKFSARPKDPVKIDLKSASGEPVSIVVTRLNHSLLRVEVPENNSQKRGASEQYSLSSVSPEASYKKHFQSSLIRGTKS